MKPKPTIEPIVISPEQKQVLDTMLNSNRSKAMKHRTMITIAGGVCLVCGDIPTKKVKYKLEDATRIEHYCSKCIPKI